jgi:hypothetical protein
MTETGSKALRKTVTINIEKAEQGSAQRCRSLIPITH